MKTMRRAYTTPSPTLAIVVALACVAAMLVWQPEASAQRVVPSRVKAQRGTEKASSLPVQRAARARVPARSQARRAQSSRAQVRLRQRSSIHARRVQTRTKPRTLAAARELLAEAGISSRKLDASVLHIGLGMPSEASRTNPEDFLLARNDYVTSYSRSRKGPNWVGWHLSGKNIATGKRTGDFRTDPTIPKSWGPATKGDYKRSGYTRGHMVASGERLDTTRANSKTFVLTNMLPQIAENNGGPWLHLENYYRDQVTKHGKEVYVMAGGLYEGPAQTIGRNKIAVPSATWKVAVIVDKGTDPAKVAESARVISIIVPNQASKVDIRQSFADFRVSPREIEKRSGLQFFEHLPVGVREALRNRIDTQAIPMPVRQKYQRDEPAPRSLVVPAPAAAL